MGCNTKRSYSFRLDSNLISSLDSKCGNRTLGLSEAIQLYLSPEIHSHYNYDTNYIQHLESEVNFLRSEVTALSVVRNPSLKDWFVGLIKSKS